MVITYTLIPTYCLVDLIYEVLVFLDLLQLSFAALLRSRLGCTRSRYAMLQDSNQQ